MFDKVADQGDLLEKLITHVSGFEWEPEWRRRQQQMDDEEGRKWTSSLDRAAASDIQTPSGGHNGEEQTNKTSTSSPIRIQ